MPRKSAGQLMDVFQPDEIQSILTALRKLPDAKNTGEFSAYTNGFEISDLIYPFIKKKIINRLEILLDCQINLVHGMLLKSFKPFGIHTDYDKEDANPDMGIIIPLNSIPIDTHTIIFNEACTNTFDKYMLDNVKLINNAASMHNTLMSHETIDRLEYVSLLGCFKWIPGSVIHWDRELLHASDDFLKNNIIEKEALVLFTTNIILH